MEVEQDFQAVFELIRNAFENIAYSDHNEHYLVERLRGSDAFVPELSLVAVVESEIIGYILLTKINIVDANANRYQSLAWDMKAIIQNLVTSRPTNMELSCLLMFLMKTVWQ